MSILIFMLEALLKCLLTFGYLFRFRIKARRSDWKLYMWWSLLTGITVGGRVGVQLFYFIYRLLSTKRESRQKFSKLPHGRFKHVDFHSILAFSALCFTSSILSGTGSIYPDGTIPGSHAWMRRGMSESVLGLVEQGTD